MERRTYKINRSILMGNFNLAISPGLSIVILHVTACKAYLLSPICTPFILLLASMKLASTSAAIICNTNESGNPWQTPCIKMKGSDRGPFILILDWMLVYATLIIQMNFSPFPNFCKTEKTKSQSTLPKTFTILQRGFYSVYLTHQLHHK